MSNPIIAPQLNITVEDLQNVNVNVEDLQNVNISVGLGGIQGPPGGQGNDGAAGTGQVSLSGYITTGHADLRYYPLNSNPFGYLSGFNSGLYVLKADTGNYNNYFFLRNETGQFYPISNPQQYIKSGEVVSIYYLNSNPSGYTINSGFALISFVTGASGNLQFQINSITSSTGQFASITNLASTGSNLNNRINSLSGYVNSPASNIVYTTGYQLIQEGKTFGLINNDFTVSGNGHVLFNITADGFVNIYNAAGGTLLTTEESTLYAPDGNPSIIFGSRVLTDSIAGQTTIDWDNRLLKSSGLTTLDYGLLTLNGNWSTDTVPTQNNHIINRGYLNSGLYTTGSITGPTNSRLQEIWIAPRTDGIQGNGTPHNPYDGSTSGKLDLLLKGFTGYSGVINFLPGQYYMNPCHKTNFASGYSMGDWSIRGAGIDRTIITATGYLSAGNGRYILFASDSEKNRIEMSDLTLDGGTRTEGVVAGLFNASSSNTLVRRVKFVNFGTRLAGWECFPLSIAARFDQTTRLTNVIVEDCIFVNPWTGVNNDGITCALITPDNTTTNQFTTAKSTDRSSIIRGCYVDLGTGIHMSGQGYSHAYTAPVVENNFARNVQKAVYYDTHSEKDIVVRNNTFLDCNYGIDFNFGGGAYRKDTIIVENNFIELLSTGKYNPALNDTNYIGIRLNGAAGTTPPYTFNHVHIEGNRISTFNGSLDGLVSYKGITATGVHNLLVQNNVIGDSFNISLSIPQNSNVIAWNNLSTGLNLLSETNAKYYLNTNPYGYIRSGDIKPSVTGISIVGSSSATGAVLFSGRSGVTLSKVNNSIFIDGPTNFKSITVESPIPGDDITLFYTNNAIQINKISCSLRGLTPSGNFSIKSDPNRNAAGTELLIGGFNITGMNTGIHFTNFSNTTISGNNWVWLTVQQTAGTVSGIHKTIFFSNT